MVEKIFQTKTIKHVRRWNIWRKKSSNSRLYKFLVLIGFTKSPTMAFVWLPEEWDYYGFVDSLTRE